MLFSDKVRGLIDTMPIGHEFKAKELKLVLNIPLEERRSKAPQVSAILLEKERQGSIVKTGYGEYKKIATIKTVSKRAWSTVKGCKNPQRTKKRIVTPPKRMVVYKGVVYPSAKEFCKLFEISGEQLSGYIDRGFYKHIAIFTTRVGAYKTANYYAKNFAKCERIRANSRDKDDDDEE